MKRFTTWDLVVIVIVGVVTGAINGLFSSAWGALFATGGPYLANTIGWVFWIGVLLAAFIVRKPGAALITGVIQGLVEMVAGTPFGLTALGWTTLQGLGVEVGFLIFRYRRWDWVSLGLASFLAGPFNFPLTFVTFDLGSAPLFGLPPFIFEWILAFFLGAGVTMLLAGGLNRTGALRGTAYAEQAVGTPAVGST